MVVLEAGDDAFDAAAARVPLPVGQPFLARGRPGPDAG
jgi:hypothetical protein